MATVAESVDAAIAGGSSPPHPAEPLFLATTELSSPPKSCCYSRSPTAGLFAPIPPTSVPLLPALVLTPLPTPPTALTPRATAPPRALWKRALKSCAVRCALACVAALIRVVSTDPDAAAVLPDPPATGTPMLTAPPAAIDDERTVLPDCILGSVARPLPRPITDDLCLDGAGVFSDASKPYLPPTLSLSMAESDPVPTPAPALGSDVMALQPPLLSGSDPRLAPPPVRLPVAGSGVPYASTSDYTAVARYPTPPLAPPAPEVYRPRDPARDTDASTALSLSSLICNSNFVC